MTAPAQPVTGLGAFRNPNYNTDSATDYPLTLDADMAILARSGDIFTVSAQDTPTMKVVVGPGYIFAGTAITVGGSGVLMVGNRDFRGDVASGSTVIRNISRVDGLVAGMLIQGSSIPLNTTIVSVDATTQGAAQITISAAATATVTTNPLRASQLTATIVAPTTNPRNDLVYIDAASGIVGIATGSQAAAPSDPALPVGKLPVARIRLTGSSVTQITNSMIDDIRAIHPAGLPQVIQNQLFNFVVDTSVVANTVTASIAPTPSGLKRGMRVSVLIAVTNTGATTLNIGVGGSTAVKKMGSATGSSVTGGSPSLVDPDAGDMQALETHDFEYDGTVWQLLNPVVHTIPQDFAFNADITPAQITSDQNDYNPSGLSTAVVLRLSSDASRNITGLQGGRRGRLIVVSNVGSNSITMKTASGSSTAANRFAFSGDVTLSGSQAATLIYDTTQSRWTMASSPPSSSSLNDQILIQDQQTSGTGGHAYGDNAWRTMTLNTTVVDTGANVVSLASNQFTLKAGSYEFHGDANVGNSAGGNPRYRARLRNITDSTTVAQGTQKAIVSNTVAVEDCVCDVNGSFTITAQKTFELQIYVPLNNGTSAGIAVSSGDVEIYASMRLRRYA